MSGYAPEAVEGFERSRVLFEQLVAGLATVEVDEQTHTELEERIGGQGRALMRQLLQDRLDLAGRVVGVDGTVDGYLDDGAATAAGHRRELRRTGTLRRAILLDPVDDVGG